MADTKDEGLRKGATHLPRKGEELEEHPVLKGFFRGKGGLAYFKIPSRALVDSTPTNQPLASSGVTPGSQTGCASHSSGPLQLPTPLLQELDSNSRSAETISMTLEQLLQLVNRTGSTSSSSATKTSLSSALPSASPPV